MKGLRVIQTLSGLGVEYLRDYAAHKLAPHSHLCIFLGYSSLHKGFRCYDPIFSRVFTTCHAQFDEVVFPFLDSTTSTASRDSDLITFLDVGCLPTTPRLASSMHGLLSLPMHRPSRMQALVDDGSAPTPSHTLDPLVEVVLLIPLELAPSAPTTPEPTPPA